MTHTHISSFCSHLLSGVLWVVLACTGTHAQTLISPAGRTGLIPGGSVNWSIGEPVIGTSTVPNGVITQGYQQPGILKVRLNLAALLEGPYVQASGLMDDALRSNGSIPLNEPYTALGHTFVGGGGESTTAPVLAVTGNDAIVDWVVIELRDAIDPTIVVASRSALLQRDGDIVERDGASPVGIRVAAGEYHIAVLHRNHLAVMTAFPYTLDAVPNTIDLSLAATPAYGTDARKDMSGAQVLWAGDVYWDGVIKYSGAYNDRDPILVSIGGIVPTATTNGYLSEDVNMDGTVKYVGTGNDRDIILQNIGGIVPTYTRPAQMP